MSSKSYKIIVASLSFCLLAILLLQGFWINQFYHQKAEEFSKTIYQALSDVSSKLMERENIQYVKQTILPKQKTIRNQNSVKVMVSASATTHSENSEDGIDIIHELNLDTVFKNGHQAIVSDSLIQIHNQHQIVIVNQKSSISQVPDKKELNKLLGKMLAEIKTIDTSPIEDIEPDSLKILLEKEFESKGIFSPVEFCLKQETGKTEEIIARSPGFKDQAKIYKSDLSTEKIFSNHHYLYVQFPGENEFVLTRMRNILLLASLFSIIMMLVFFYTLRTILKQKKISDIKHDFMNNMTHELKTPIATISLAIDAISNPTIKRDEERFEKYTSILKEENQKLNNHVEHVLQMALLDRGEMQLHHTKVNIIRLMYAAINDYHLQIADRQATVHFNPSKKEVYIWADEFHLQSVFNNLLDNALKCSKEKSIINISVTQSFHQVIISFKDNGIGIEQALHKRIFEKFYRVQSGNLHDEKGFGLGLSYVKSIVEKHKGMISVLSEKGKGSEFIIKLPYHGH